MKIKNLFKKLQPASRQSLMEKVANKNDTVLFTDGLGPNEINYRAERNGIPNYGTIKNTHGKWEIKKVW